MEAHGHERIGSNVSKFMRELIKLKYPEVYKEMYKRFISNGETDNSIDPMEHALYLGNWLSDFSQFFATDSFYQAKVGAGSLIGKYNEGLGTVMEMMRFKDGRLTDILKKSMHEAVQPKGHADEDEHDHHHDHDHEHHVISEEDEQDLLSTFSDILIGTEPMNQIQGSTQAFLDNMIGLFKAETNRFLDGMERKLTLSGTFVDDLESDRSFVFDNRDYMWEIAYAVIRLLGFKKFVVGGEKQMAPGDFSFIVSHFISNYTADVGSFSQAGNAARATALTTAGGKVDPDEEEKRRLHFKLNQYYPPDHLDRPFSNKYLKQDREEFKQGKAGNIGKEPLSKEAYIERLASETKGFDGQPHRIYKYLYDFLDVVAGKLTDLNLRWVVNSFLEKKGLDDEENLLFAAQLGQTLHGVEDFFAHSTFLEHLVYNLDHLREGIDSDRQICTQEEFLALLKKNEVSRYESALRMALPHDYYKSRRVLALQTEEWKKKNRRRRINEAPQLLGSWLAVDEALTNMKIAHEPKLVTGFFGSTDMMTSMYHLIFGKLQADIEDGAYGDKILSLGHKLFPAVIDDPDDPGIIDGTIYFFKLVDTMDEFDVAKDHNGDPQREFQTENFLQNIMNGNLTVGEFFTEDDWKALFDADYFRGTYKTFPALKHNMGGGESELLRDLVNKVMYGVSLLKTYKQGKEAFDNAKGLKEIFKIAVTLISLILFPEFFAYHLSKLMIHFESLLLGLLKEVALKLGTTFVDQYVTNILKKALNMVAQLVENNLLHLHGMHLAGSHSVIAKDEEFRNKGFNQQAIRCAVFMDQLIVMALLGESKKLTQDNPGRDGRTEGYEMVDLQHLIHKFLAHPLDEQGTEFLPEQTPQNVKSDGKFEQFGVVSCSLHDYSIQKLYEGALKARNKNTYSPEEFELEFLSKNPGIKQKDLTNPNVTLRKRFGLLNRKQDNEFEAGTLYQVYIPTARFTFFQSLQLEGFQVPAIRLPSVEVTSVVSNWGVHFFSKKDLSADGEFSLQSSLMDDYLERLGKKFGQEEDDTIPVDPELENIDSIIGIFEHLKLGEPYVKYLSKEEATQSMEKGIQTEIKVKQDHERFMEEYVNYPGT